MRTRSTGVISSSRVRIGLIFSAEPIQARGAADPPAAPQVLEGVDREPHLQLLAGLLGPGDRRLAVATTGRGRRGGQGAEAHPAGRRARVEDVDALPALALVDEALAGLVGGLAGAGDAGRDVDRDDLAPGLEQRLVDGDEVADRGLRGGRAALGGAQPLEEPAVVADLGLGRADRPRSRRRG